jgi:anti-sigma factor RsiW
MKYDEHLCAEIESTLPLYVGGDLEPKALGEVRQHLLGCPRCAERALAARSARRELVSALRLDGHPGPDLWAGVRAAVRDEGLFAPTTSTAPIVARELQPSAPQRRAAARVWRAWPLVAAASVAAAVLGLWIGLGLAADPTVPNRPTEPAFLAVNGPAPKPHVPAASILVPVSDDAQGEGDGVHGLRRLRQGERQMREDAILIQDDGPYPGIPLQSDRTMVPVGLQRVGGPR